MSTDRRHDRRALTPEEFSRLIHSAQNGPVIEMISGPDRNMMYVLAAWTGFRKGEVGSLTRRSFRLDDDPPSATVAACYSKRKREDTQILHPEIACRLKNWLETKPNLGTDDLLFPVSRYVPGGKERKTHKMMQRDLETARNKWIDEAKTAGETNAREKSDFLKYRDDNGLFADFHANRHLFITSLERAKLSPKMAQTLARHSDVRLTLGIYTHIDLHDQRAAIESLPAPRPALARRPRPPLSALRERTPWTAKLQIRTRPPGCRKWCHCACIGTATDRTILHGISRTRLRRRRPEDRRNSRHNEELSHRTRTACIALHQPTGWQKGSIPGRIRTCNLRLRRPALYPIELRRRFPFDSENSASNDSHRRSQHLENLSTRQEYKKIRAKEREPQ